MCALRVGCLFGIRVTVPQKRLHIPHNHHPNHGTIMTPTSIANIASHDSIIASYISCTITIIIFLVNFTSCTPLCDEHFRCVCVCAHASRVV